MPDDVIRFGRCALDAGRRELRVDGRPARLGERAFALLLALAEAGGRPVPRDVLFERAWPGRAVLDDNLKVQVMALRRVLGAEAVVTVPGVGYRLAMDAPAPPPAPLLAADMLLGRAEELQRLRAQWQPGRLVSVLGPGGIGKTRLARAAAEGLPADALLFVELAPLSDPQALAGTLARGLGLPPGADEAALLAALRPLALHLVLDNAEHLLDAVAPLVQRLREAAPRLALLVTSQAPLELPGEQLLRLEGLATPADDSAAALAASPAAALFAARVRAAGFDVDDADGAADGAAEGAAVRAADRAALARLCRRLDGIPLALELAAARVPLLGVAGVERHLDEALELLTRGARGAPPRQQTLRAALQWSHGLLDDAHKRVFRRLGVFAGGFTPEAAQQVAADDALDAWAVLDALDALVARSLVQLRAEGDARRCQLLETARLFALERLEDAGEAADTRRRHAQWLAAHFEAADAAYTAQPALPWRQALMPELPNLRAAVEWALGADEQLAIRLCAAAGGFWAMTGLHAESGPPMKRLAARLDAGADASVPTAVQARFWLAVANRGADYSFTWGETHAAAERAVALARAAGDAALLHRALGHLVPLAQRVGATVDAEATAAEMRALEGEHWTPLQRRARRAIEAFAYFQRGEWARFGELEEQELRHLRAAGDVYRAWVAAHRLALAYTATGRAREAQALLRTAAAEIRAHRLQRHCWQQLAMLAMTGIEAGDAPAEEVHEAVRLMQGAGALAWMACHLGEWLQQRGRPADAARLLGWVARRHAERGEAPSGHGERARDRTLQALNAAAGEAQLAAWQAEGAAWGDDDVAAALLAA